jgi:hypothetical protein
MKESFAVKWPKKILNPPKDIIMKRGNTVKINQVYICKQNPEFREEYKMMRFVS